MTTLFYIIAFLLGALITSEGLYIAKLREKVEGQKGLIKAQHELIEALTIAAFEDKIKKHLAKKDCGCDKEQPASEDKDADPAE